MSEQLEFSLKQTVWARVDSYPPWPAKVVRKLNLHGKTVYKVNFYGDPTYCYLHSHSLLPFSLSETIDLNQTQQNPKLKKAIQLAQLAVSKSNQHFISPIQENPIKPILKPIETLALEQTLIHSQNSIELPQKNFQLQNYLPFTNFKDNSIHQEISPQNVFQILDSYHHGKMNQRIANLKRKQIITFENQLKSNLLLKYNLHSIDHIKQTPKLTQNTPNPILALRNAKRSKKNRQTQKFEQKELCVRKIQKLLYQKGMQREQSYKTSLKIVNQIEKRSETMGKNGPSYFRENIFHSLYQISSNIEQIEQVSLEYVEKNILSVLDLQFHQNKLEEGSHMTQIHEEFGV